MELSVQIAPSLTRNATAAPFGRTATNTAFATGQGEIGIAPVDNSPERLVFRITDVNVPAYAPSGEDPVAGQISGALTDDLLGQYLAQLQNSLGVAINEQALRQAFGQTDEF